VKRGLRELSVMLAKGPASTSPAETETFDLKVDPVRKAKRKKS
jgi:hypothetical protein